MRRPLPHAPAHQCADNIKTNRTGNLSVELCSVCLREFSRGYDIRAPRTT